MPKERREGALSSLAKAELRDEVGVALRIFLAEVIEQRPALVDHHQEAAPAMVVLGMALEMVGQRLDAAGQDRDLDFGRTRIVLGAGMFLDHFLLALGGNRHRVTPIRSKVETPDDLEAVGRG